MALVRERYADLGPTFAAEKLTELHGFGISRETLRHWMIEDGLWLDRRRRLPSVHQPRNRRECLGKLVQIDGSDQLKPGLYLSLDENWGSRHRQSITFDRGTDSQAMVR